MPGTTLSREIPCVADPPKLYGYDNDNFLSNRFFISSQPATPFSDRMVTTSLLLCPHFKLLTGSRDPLVGHGHSEMRFIARAHRYTLISITFPRE